MTIAQRAVLHGMPRNHGIDILRGLAILLVVLHHTGLRIALKSTALADLLPKRVLGALNYNGYEAVFVFFVISGFLIASHSLTRWGSLARIDAPAFYARRAARILPCLVLLVAVLATLHLVGAQDYVINRETQSLARATLAVFALHLNWYEGATGYLPGGWDVLWSLSIEEVFYLGFPLLCLGVRSERLLAIVLAALLLVLPFSLMAITDNEIWKEKAYLPGMAAIAAGVLVALIARRWQPRNRTIPRGLAAIGVAGLLALMFAMRELWPLFHDTVMLLLVVFAACLVLALAWLHDGDARRTARHWLAAFDGTFELRNLSWAHVRRVRCRRGVQGKRRRPAPGLSVVSASGAAVVGARCAGCQAVLAAMRVLVAPAAAETSRASCRTSRCHGRLTQHYLARPRSRRAIPTIQKTRKHP